MDTELGSAEIVAEPYESFRARVRDTFIGQGWTCIDSDEEADFFVKDRWELYASPADPRLGLPSHSVVMFEFPTEASRQGWDAGIEEEEEEATLHREFSVKAARDLLMRLDPDVVHES